MSAFDAANTDPVQAERRGPFWFVRLNRPDKRNALNEPLLAAFEAVCDRVESDDDARALVLWGAGGHFCAGADFGQFLALLEGPAVEPDPIVLHNRSFGRTLERFAGLPVPTVVVVRGSAMGGAMGFVAAADRVVAAEDAVFAMPEVSLGVIPAQIAPFVARRIGDARARWLALQAGRLDAVAARDLGIADVVQPCEALPQTVAAQLAGLARGEPRALRSTKRMALRNPGLPLGAALDAAAMDFATQLRSGAAREGIAATRERRAPAWHASVPDLPEFD